MKPVAARHRQAVAAPADQDGVGGEVGDEAAEGRVGEDDLAVFFAERGGLVWGWVGLCGRETNTTQMGHVGAV